MILCWFIYMPRLVLLHCVCLYRLHQYSIACLKNRILDHDFLRLVKVHDMHPKNGRNGNLGVSVL